MHSRRTNLVLAAVHALAAGGEANEAPSSSSPGTTLPSASPNSSASSLPGSSQGASRGSSQGASRGKGFTQSDISAYLRARGEPMSAWEVRGELSVLERSGEVRIEPTTAVWFLADPPTASAQAAKN